MEYHGYGMDEMYGGKGPNLHDVLNKAYYCIVDLEQSLEQTPVKGWQLPIDKMFLQLEVIDKHIQTVIRRREKAKKMRERSFNVPRIRR